MTETTLKNTDINTAKDLLRVRDLVKHFFRAGRCYAACCRLGKGCGWYLLLYPGKGNFGTGWSIWLWNKNSRQLKPAPAGTDQRVD